MLITYQNLEAVGQNDANRIDFVYQAIQNHKTSLDYNIAMLADEYDRKQNVTIKNYQRLIYDITGEAKPDTTGNGFKLISADFPFLIEQRTQFLLGNGVVFNDDSTSKRLGENFDTQIQEAGHCALVEKVAFGFFNNDHIDVFRLTEFVPLYDEENGSLRAGIRFWQLDTDKPLRAVLYEEDGYTGYIWDESQGDGRVRDSKTAYKYKTQTTIADGTKIYDGENYPIFPIVPFWGNKKHQSEFIGMQEKIDCYDLIESGFANTVEEASYIYWAIQNAGGMDDQDLVEFVDKMRKLHAAVTEDNGSKVDAHTIEAPHESREAILVRLKEDIYRDFGGFDPKNIASGAATATQIRAAYEPLNQAADGFEFCAIQFIKGILAVAGIDDDPTFTRSMIVNVQEEVQTVLQAASYLDSEYVVMKILTLFGDGDKLDEVLKRKDVEDMERMRNLPEEDESEEIEEE